MKNINSKSLIINGILFLVFNLSFAQKKNNSIEIYQFHNEHRCVTCLEIEKLTKEVLKTQGGIPFKLINVDEKKNEKLAEKFAATSTALRARARAAADVAAGSSENPRGCSH